MKLVWQIYYVKRLILVPVQYSRCNVCNFESICTVFSLEINVDMLLSGHLKWIYYV
jgi:hypothetical protein